MKSWIHVKTTNDEYFTPFKSKKAAYTHIDNRKDLSPVDICGFLNENVDSVHYGDGVFEYNVELQESEFIELPPGVYRHVHGGGDRREGLVPFTMREDEYIELSSDSAFKEVEKDLKDFLAAEDFYKEINTLYKLGILLYGPPGGGKSTQIRKIVKDIIPKDAVVIYISGSMFSLDFNDMLKETLGDRLKVFIFEELTTATSSAREVERILNFLDGESSLNRMLTIGTTNYPEALPGNIVDRHGRFDKLIYFADPSLDDIAKVLSRYLGKQLTVDSEEVKACKGFTIATIKEVVTLMRVNNVTLVDVVKKMKKRSDLVKKQFAQPKQSTVGFGGYDYD